MNSTLLKLTLAFKTRFGKGLMVNINVPEPLEQKKIALLPFKICWKNAINTT